MEWSLRLSIGEEVTDGEDICDSSRWIYVSFAQMSRILVQENCVLFLDDRGEPILLDNQQLRQYSHVLFCLQHGARQTWEYPVILFHINQY